MSSPATPRLETGIVYRANAEPPGCHVYYAIDRAGELAFEVTIPMRRETPEWIEFLERQAQQFAEPVHFQPRIVR